MEAFECLLDRRSVRKFREGEIPDETMVEILKAAMYAPSAGNQRPWHFVVIRSRKTLERIMDFIPTRVCLRMPVWR